MHFGFLPQSLDVSSSKISIRCIADWRKMLADIISQGRVSNGWLQMPLRDVHQAGRYELPVTHNIELHGSQDDERLRFLVLVLGFLLGLRLVPQGWGHLHATAVETGRCNSFLLMDKDVIPCLELASQFYQKYRQTRNVKRILSAVTLSQWSQVQPLQFDEFNYLYMTIDVCWAICEDTHPMAVNLHRKNGRGPITHQLRPTVMCHILNLSLPEIFDSSSPVTAASIRNDLLHEGLVGDLPIGLTVIKPHCTLEMREFAEKLILSLLGVKAGYLGTSGGDRQHHLLDLRS
jgi:hypothetical protein